MRDLNAYIEKAKAEDIIIKNDRAIIDKMVIDRKNDLMLLLFKFREYLKENADKLKGKKLKMADGSKTKFFSQFLEQWPEMQEIKDQTNVTVERSIYSLLYIDSEGKPREREEGETLYTYDMKIYTLSDLQESQELIKSNQFKIKELQKQNDKANEKIPFELQERRY